MAREVEEAQDEIFFERKVRKWGNLHSRQKDALE